MAARRTVFGAANLYGGVLRVTREQLGMTQEDVVFTLRGETPPVIISISTLAKIENQSRKLETELFFAICKVLNIDPSVLHKHATEQEHQPTIPSPAAELTALPA